MSKESEQIEQGPGHIWWFDGALNWMGGLGGLLLACGAVIVCSFVAVLIVGITR